MIIMKKIVLPLSVLVLALGACGGSSTKKAEQSQGTSLLEEGKKLEAEVGEKARVFFKPLISPAESPDNELTEAKVKLGKVLYFDKRLSKNNDISCNSCHNLSTFGVDNLPVSPGDKGQLGDRNSPTVLNAAFHKSQFWDGRASSIEEQAGMPILNPVEMAIPSEQYLVDKLSKIDLYKKLFADAFPGQKKPLTYDNLKKAIGAFERTLVTPSRFDEYLNGNTNALTIDEKKGLKAFMDAGCTSCHSGALLGGNMFQKFGTFFDYWEFTKSEKIDEGRFAHTGNEGDKFSFKVPSLRNIEKTHPYFHDGSVEKLEDAVKIMAKVNLNKDFTDAEVKNVVKFLQTLTGELPAEVAAMPEELL
jgi:cytochrome c peroxidase